MKTKLGEQGKRIDSIARQLVSGFATMEKLLSGLAVQTPQTPGNPNEEDEGPSARAEATGSSQETWPQSPSKNKVKEELKERLRALGYIQ